MDPNYSMAHYNLSYIYLFNGDIKKGFELYQHRFYDDTFKEEWNNNSNLINKLASKTFVNITPAAFSSIAF